MNAGWCCEFQVTVYKDEIERLNRELAVCSADHAQRSLRAFSLSQFGNPGSSDLCGAAVLRITWPPLLHPPRSVTISRDSDGSGTSGSESSGSFPGSLSMGRHLCGVSQTQSNLRTYSSVHLATASRRVALRCTSAIWGGSSLPRPSVAEVSGTGRLLRHSLLSICEQFTYFGRRRWPWHYVRGKSETLQLLSGVFTLFLAPGCRRPSRVNTSNRKGSASKAQTTVLPRLAVAAK